MINILFALFSTLAGIFLAEIAYVLLLIIEYVMLGSFNFELASAWHYLKVGGGGRMHNGNRDCSATIFWR